jgi:hypothetical protein
MAGDRLIDVLDEREQVIDAEPPAGVGDLDTAVNDFGEGGRWAMRVRCAHGEALPVRPRAKPPGGRSRA